MKRSEINVFGTSFLDLLSGALAAVIILFVIVPKMSASDLELVQQVKEIQEITTDIKAALEKIKNGVSKDVYEQIEQELVNANAKLDELNGRLRQLEEYAKNVATENAELHEIIRQQQEEIEALKKQIESLKESLREKNGTANTVDKSLGVFAKFGIICRWTESDADVDVGVQRFGSNPEQCWRMYPSKPWGILGQDVRERLADDEEEHFELFYIPQIYPDEYTLWANVYSGSNASSANITCTMVFHPGKPDEVRRELGQFSVDKYHTTLVVSFRLTDRGFDIIPTREPIWGTGKVIK